MFVGLFFWEKSEDNKKMNFGNKIVKAQIRKV